MDKISFKLITNVVGADVRTGVNMSINGQASPLMMDVGVAHALLRFSGYAGLYNGSQVYGQKELDALQAKIHEHPIHVEDRGDVIALHIPAAYVSVGLTRGKKASVFLIDADEWFSELRRVMAEFETVFSENTGKYFPMYRTDEEFRYWLDIQQYFYQTQEELVEDSENFYEEQSVGGFVKQYRPLALED